MTPVDAVELVDTMLGAIALWRVGAVLAELRALAGRVRRVEQRVGLADEPATEAA